eukprot:6471764-Amphidinium_carterae.3
MHGFTKAGILTLASFALLQRVMQYTLVVLTIMILSCGMAVLLKPIGTYCANQNNKVSPKGLTSSQIQANP